MNTLLAATLNDNLAEIVGKLQSLMDSFWIYIVMALAAVVVVWGAFVGIKIAIAHKNEEKINARDMVKNLIIGIIIIFVVAMGAPLLSHGLSAWVGAESAHSRNTNGAADFFAALIFIKKSEGKE